MTIPKNNNGRISSNKIMWWIVAFLFTLLILAISAISSFRSSSAKQFSESLDYIGRRVEDERVINAKQEVEILETRKDVKEIRKDIDSIELMMRDIYKITVGISR